MIIDWEEIRRQNKRRIFIQGIEKHTKRLGLGLAILVGIVAGILLLVAIILLSVKLTGGWGIGFGALLAVLAFAYGLGMSME